ncbi:MAG: cation:dicarboxylase symporter family transporter [Synergistales bacterium]|nr:cation:dicarboxylase symporter family transporter [Synergistales bacterium]MDY6402244.1 cation:dicarboxylase symporter family transporter [Synergistales bacterium]MDY6404977.1 cation:dicarboxylase symporter family transporter [Synergistales bacterium]MDY6410326.1 cation:dicarboxylase symporter family transporter [Synergistales bacterium]MDY6414326.1 cation:dicarboxylase symporter family transporter [Synergistales bacterium]
MSKGFTSSLPFKLIVALVLGIVVGLGLTSIEGSALCTALLNIIVTVRFISGQFINFCVPLIIIGFVAPSITRLGSNASKMLLLALTLAYVSSIGAAFAATAAGYSILPFMNIVSEVEGLKALPDVLFKLSIPQIMPVMSALFLSVTVGLAAAWNRSKYFINLLEEFQKIVLSIVTNFLIPVLPLLIGTTFCGLAYEGSITKQFPVFVMIILIVMIGHYIWLALLYFIAGAYSGRNPFNIIKHYGPAYMTAVGTMSSAATLSVALECARKSEPTLRDDMVNFGIPLFANIHLCGSVMTETFFVMAVSKILYGVYPSVGNMILFCLLLGVFAIGAPGVPGGTVMASLGLITGVLGFDATGTALMLTIFALQDSFGTACNVTGDGALTLILTGYAEKHNIAEQKLENILG